METFKVCDYIENNFTVVNSLTTSPSLLVHEIMYTVCLNQSKSKLEL